MTEPKQTLNPWLGMLLRPRETIRQLANTSSIGRILGIIGLLVILGVAESVVRYVRLGTQPSLKFLLVYLVTSLLLALIAFLLLPAVLLWTGKRAGGVATLNQLRAAYAWGSVPNLLELALFIPLTAVFGAIVPQGLGGGLNTFYGGGSFTYLTLLVLRVIFIVWSFVVSVITVAEVQKLAVGKTIFTFMLSGLILLVPFFLLSELNKWIFQLL
jgi:hypothetical protein